MPIRFDDITAAAHRIAGQVSATPCPPSIPLSELTGLNVFCKLEYLQRTGSFKERGACNALLLLNPEEKRRGVIAASAGNHALGLAFHARLLGIPATVLMPRTAPLTKIVNCRRLGAKVVLAGNTLEEAREHGRPLIEQEGLTYINGYDDLAIIAGQGTVGLEIARQIPEGDAVIVPIGGGGLIAGSALALKTIQPNVELIGVEPERAASFSAARRAGHPVKVATQSTLADGLSISMVGENAFGIAQPLVNRVITVSERELALAILRLTELEKAVVEGAGAASLAACLGEHLTDLKGKNVVLPLTGGNIDTTILGRVLERGLASDGRLCRFTATISDRPGGLATFARIVAEEEANIVDIAHDRAFASEDISKVTVHCIVETRDTDHIAALRNRLAREGFEVS